MIYYTGLDYLRINLPDKFDSPLLDSYLLGLSSNSNQKFVSLCGEDFEVKEIPHSQYKLVQLQYNGDSVIEIKKNVANLISPVSYQLTFYSSFFYVPSLLPIFDFFLVKFGDHASVGRVDIALDCDIPINHLHESVVTKFRKSYVISDSKDIKTFYLGSKANNRKHFIRVYDKKLDSRKKSKFHLFTSYLKHPVVTRIEVQCNPDTCRKLKITPNKIYNSFKGNDDFIVNIFKTLCVNETSTMFTQLRLETLKYKFLDYAKLDYNVMSLTAYGKRFLSLARGLREYGIDPVQFLNENGGPSSAAPSTP